MRKFVPWKDYSALTCFCSASSWLSSTGRIAVVLMRGTGDFRVERAGLPSVHRHQLRFASRPYNAPGRTRPVS